jgi:hypothetical protein
MLRCVQLSLKVPSRRHPATGLCLHDFIQSPKAGPTAKPITSNITSIPTSLRTANPCSVSTKSPTCQSGPTAGPSSTSTSMPTSEPTRSSSDSSSIYQPSDPPGTEQTTVQANTSRQDPLSMLPSAQLSLTVLRYHLH